ncbi:MAG: carboxypeptidase-like regulatory domain-containing protein [Bacteroidales bacterium]|nr:carboxypeptidase-like regulatory domain-containing protein [Bacteroidales bacterium]
MKRLLTTGIFFMLSTTLLLASGGDKKPRHSFSDTTNFIEIEGKLIDEATKKPVVFATVFVTGTSIGTVSNIDGEFILKVPKNKEQATISFAHIGYENKIVAVAGLLAPINTIEIKTATVPIDEVVVRPADGLAIILAALEKIPSNYSDVAEMQTAFYRETVKQNKKYVSVSEAVLDIYKAPYKSTFDYDRLKIYKGRKSHDVKKMDTVVVKLQGGPKTSLLLDVVKNPGDILDRETLEYYNFFLAGITTVDNRETYVIHFDQKDGVEYPLYMGNIYIDTKTYAFSGFDFNLSEKGLPYASKYLVKKKPVNMKIDVENGHYLIKYRFDNDRWYLNYVRSEIEFSSKWKQKLFKSDFQIMLEMAVTDRDRENIEKFATKETVKLNEVFADQVSYFEDDSFWGDYNTIKPDESIEVAIEKLNRKLKRRQ